MASIEETALRLLARREHSRKELQQKLAQRGFPEIDIRTIVPQLEADNLLSEERYIEAFIRARRRKGHGPLKICAELQKYGIDLNQVQASEEWQQTSWEEFAMAVRTKRFGESLPKSQKEKLQQWRFLQQRGFTTDQIRTAFQGDP